MDNGANDAGLASSARFKSGVSGGPQRADELSRHRPHEVAGDASGQGPLLALEAVFIGDDEDAGVTAVANVAERLTAASQERIHLALADLIGQQRQEVKAFHVGQFVADEPDIGSEAAGQFDGRIGVVAENCDKRAEDNNRRCTAEKVCMGEVPGISQR